jgi:hypothetical protein
MLRITGRVAAGVAMAAAVITGLSSVQASQASVQPDQIVSAVPSLDVPQVRDGRVQALAQVGDTIVLGGTFTKVSDAGGTAIPRTYIAAYDRITHKLSRSFAPVLDGQVWTIIAGSQPGTVYIGGDFRTINGQKANRVALLDATTGAVDPTFVPSPASSTVRTLGLSGGHLFVGGTFAKVGGKDHSGMVTLDPVTGRLDPFVNSQFTVNHSFGRVSGANQQPVGVIDLAISPDGTQMTAIGNFRMVDGELHDQIALFDLTGTTAQLRSDWTTSYFTAPCYSWAYDYWVRDVAYSPDGSYFVVGSTGGGNVDLCDAVGRFESNSSGSNVQPTWIASTGGDSIYAMAVADDAIYAGGHFRWVNNPTAVDRKGAGAVPRPGLVALDPLTGIPLPWNPGRHPRDKGVFAMLLTDSEFILGQDTSWIGHKQYHTYKLASFPLAGGQQAPSTAITGLPATLNRVVRTDFFNAGIEPHPVSSTEVGPATSSATPLSGFSNVRGATVVGGYLYLAMSDKTLHKRTYDGVTMGPDILVNPYSDPVWDNVRTGLGETYKGVPSGFENQMSSLTGMFYLGGKMYYTLSNSSTLRTRAFEPGSGIMHPVERAVPGVSLPSLRAMTYADGYLFYVRADNLHLMRQAFDGTSLVGDAVDLGTFDSATTLAMFIAPSPPAGE